MSMKKSQEYPDNAPAPIDSPSLRRLPPLLRRAWYSLNQAFRRRIAHLKITPDQFTVLRWLQEDASNHMTQRTLADLMASDPNTVTSVLNRMEAVGYIQRRPHETDRRAKRIILKPKGAAVYKEARKIAIEIQTHVLEALPESERESFLKNMEIVADAARELLDNKPASK